MPRICFVLLTSLLLMLAIPSASQAQQQQLFQYQLDTTTVVANPERGFQPESYADDTGFEGGDVSDHWNRQVFAGYQAGTSDAINGAHAKVCRRMYYLYNFRTQPISQAYLNLIQAQIDSIRAGGMKVKIRFAYAGSGRGVGNPSMQQMLAHIQQLSPLLKRNGDVIIAYQMGFIGQGDGEWWGDNTYNLGADYGFTDYKTGGNAGTTDTTDQRILITAFLRAIPSYRGVELRYPRVIMWIYGATPVTTATAFDGSDKSRVGFYNDAFATRGDDMGTYDMHPNRWNNGGGANDDTSFAKKFIQALTPWVNTSFETDATDGAFDGSGASYEIKVQAEMQRMHMQGGNPHYSPGATSIWKSTGAFARMDKFLGYRFGLRQASVPQQAPAGGACRITGQIANMGWANVVNPRGFELVLVNPTTRDVIHINLLKPRQQPYDPRFWMAGTTTSFDTTVQLPASMVAGTWQSYLNFPDTCASLYANAAYSIQLLQQPTTWQAKTGYNFLGNIQVTSGTPPPPPPPASVPPTPVVLAASAITSTGFTANWSAATGATGYYLDVATNSDFSALISGYYNKDVGGVTTAQVSGLTATTPYWYRVRAYNAAGVSGNTIVTPVTTTGTTPPPPPPPPPPSSIPVAPVVVAATNVTAQGFTANWLAATGATGYFLDVATDSSFPGTAMAAGYYNRTVPNVTSLQVSGLTASTSYWYRLRASNSAGTSGSTVVMAITTAGTTPPPPPPPSQFVVMQLSNASVNLPPNGGTLTIGILAVGTLPLAWSAFPADVSWLHPGGAGAILSVNFDQNVTGAPRVGTLVVKSNAINSPVVISIIQSGVQTGNNGAKVVISK